ncbi:MAG: type II toxin-antitoxin system HigB family toxin [Trueperaceae bacterium]|nr:type II toxin-antitoxin system HigB family toxin [Trueperaceae bacterium]
MQKNDFSTWAELKVAFPSADYVGDRQVCIFNIGENRFRLVVDISFSQHRVFIKRILTHAEYDKWSRGGRK